MNEAVANSPATPTAEQQELFADELQLPDDAGYRAPVVAKLVGITYRQLDYWAHRVGRAQPAYCEGFGIPAPVQLPRHRDVEDRQATARNRRDPATDPYCTDHLRNTGVSDLSQITLMSDGASVYECRSAGCHRPRAWRPGGLRDRRRCRVARWNPIWRRCPPSAQTAALRWWTTNCRAAAHARLDEPTFPERHIGPDPMTSTAWCPRSGMPMSMP